MTYGIKNPESNLTAYNIQVGKGISFDVKAFGKDLGRIKSSLLGKHNILNILATISVGLKIGIDFARISGAIESFEGVERRLELKGEKNGIIFFDDYGHHPTEIRATLEALKNSFQGRRIVLVFQPHRFSRTFLLMERFPDVLKLADFVILTDIYPAGEENVWNITGRAFYERLKIENPNMVFCETLDECASVALSTLEKGDIFITMGAGNVKDVLGMVWEKMLYKLT
jgi:UDP-N-acetylmuramate--alanine ligase